MTRVLAGTLVCLAILPLALLLAIPAHADTVPLSPISLAAPVAPKATLTVTNTNDSGVGSLRNAIAIANNGDVIDFSLSYPAVITLTTGELSVLRNLTISGPGSSNLSISANHASRVLSLSSGFGLTMTGVTLRDGFHNSAGGGIRLLGTSAMTLTDVVLYNNVVACAGVGCSGGAIHNNNTSTLIMTTSSIISNSVDSGSTGGGLYNGVDAVATLTNVTVTLNSANTSSYGGGAYNDGTLIVTGGVFSGNSAESGEGGAIYNPSLLIMNGTTITNNMSVNGGGIGSSSGSPRTYITNTTLISNTSTASGGGIYTSGAVTITASTIVSNTANNSGGGLRLSGNTTIDNSTIGDAGRPNRALTSAGGGIYNQGLLTVTNSMISYNVTNNNNGGGINNLSTATVMTSTIANNSGESGGGISNSGTLMMSTSAVNGNTGVSNGGGVMNNSGKVTISNSTLSNNRQTIANNGGAAIRNDAELIITNTTIYSNTSANSGGGLLNFGTVTMTNATLANNSSSVGGGGGGIYSFFGSVTLRNTVVTTSTVGGNCLGTTIFSGGYNIDSANTCAFAATGDLTNTNPVLSALANHGGSTQTMALLPGSPAINRVPVGTNGCGTSVATDQRGITRPQGTLCDIGAFEALPYIYIPLIFR